MRLSCVRCFERQWQKSLQWWGFNEETHHAFVFGVNKASCAQVIKTRDHTDTMLRQCLQTRAGQIEINLGEKYNYKMFFFFYNTLC